MKTLLWLDDYRNPFDKEIDWMVFSPIGRDCKIEWVKSYFQFKNWIEENGLPDGICFDHDLNDSNFHIKKSTYKERTGYECAKWLVEYCIDNELELPKYNVQSANPTGKENIIRLLENFIKFSENNF